MRPTRKRWRLTTSPSPAPFLEEVATMFRASKTTSKSTTSVTTRAVASVTLLSFAFTTLLPVRALAQDAPERAVREPIRAEETVSARDLQADNGDAVKDLRPKDAQTSAKEP